MKKKKGKKKKPLPLNCKGIMPMYVEGGRDGGCGRIAEKCTECIRLWRKGVKCPEGVNVQ